MKKIIYIFTTIILLSIFIYNFDALYYIKNAETGTIVSYVTFLLAGLVDGVNPCALSMLIFFIMTITNMEKSKNIFKIGIFFASGTFITYFASGLGLLSFINYFEEVYIVNNVLYGAAVLIALILGILNIKDAYYAKKGEYNKISLQLSNSNKKLVHNIIKYISKNEFKYFASFLLGILVTITELLCTGQIYVSAIIAISKMENIYSNFYLLIFNLGFIIPIMVITYTLSKTKEIFEMSDIIIDKLWIIKTITAVVMFALAYILFIQLL